ncbi:hypothetical protein [Streptomyces sp. S186]|uniref:hypothetical protein n=1 Tax=Streptomyces sp. S186 TaxID=3434395 RepID=UPI003F66826F
MPIGLFLAGAAALSLTACSGTSNDAPSKPSASKPASDKPTPTDPTETAKRDAIATYQSYWKEMEKLYADRSGKSANLKGYAASAALENAESDAKRAHDRNRIHIGQVSVGSPTVTKLDMKGKVPNATLSSCLDISRWQVVDATTKKPVTLPSNRLTKYVIVTTVERWPDGWRVIRDEPQNKSC